MGEERGVGEIPGETLYSEMREGGAMKTQYMRYLLGHHLNAYPAVLEIRHADHARLPSPLRLLCLLGREAMRDTDMSACGIQTRHLRAKQATVGRTVLPLVHCDIIMNHLVEDDVLHYIFG